MMEIGPWRFDSKDSLRQKEGGWEEYANVLYREGSTLDCLLERPLTAGSPSLYS